tara:strand:- start:161 stop:1105 length:945 start_codon:yes stop_codon:yes gene_type:complete
VKSDSVKLGLIGAGAWGINYIKTISKVKGIKLVGICTKSGRFKKNYLFKKDFLIYKDWKKLVSTKNIDGVIIASPANTHFQIAKYCICLGIPIIVEKPITLNLSQANYIYELAKKNKAIVFVNHIHLYHPAFKELKKKVKDSKNIISLYSVAGGNGPFRKDVRALWDWGSHDIAMSIDIMGSSPEIIEASYLSKSNEESREGEIIQAQLLFEKQKKATLIFGNLMKNKRRIFDLKTEKQIFRYQPLEKEHLIKISNYQNKFLFSAKKIPSSLSAMEILINDFINQIKKKEEKFNDLKLALKVTSVIESISYLLN